MNIEEFMTLGVPVEATSENVLAVESGLAWISKNTSFVQAKGEELPGNVKMFLVKYVEIICRNGTVTSESLAGMSQSFSTEEIGSLLRQYAETLLGEWYKGGAKFIPAVRRWA